MIAFFVRTYYSMSHYLSFLIFQAAMTEEEEEDDDDGAGDTDNDCGPVCGDDDNKLTSSTAIICLHFSSLKLKSGHVQVLISGFTS